MPAVIENTVIEHVEAVEEQVWFTCLVNTQAQARNHFLTYTGDFSEKNPLYLPTQKPVIFSSLAFSLIFSFSLFQIQFCLFKSVTYWKGYQKSRIKVKSSAAPQSNAVSQSSSSSERYSLCKYLSLSLNQCFSLHTYTKKHCL